MGNLSATQKYIIGLIGIVIFIPIVILLIRPFLVSSGTVINGVFSLASTIPSNSTITLLVKDTSTPTGQFMPVEVNLPAKDFSSWQFNGGKSGVTYQIKAQLLSNGKTTESNILTVTAPAANQVLKFSFNAEVTPTPAISLAPTHVPTPTAKPVPTRVPTPTAELLMPIVTPTTTPATQSATASISGTLSFTGQPPVSSRVVIFERVTGTTSFQVAVDNFVPKPLSVWVWQGIPSTSYDFIAILKQKQSDGTDTDLLTSSAISLSAPSTTGALSLSYTPTLGAPAPNIFVTCGSLDGPSQNWGATVNFQTITGAASYWFEIGTTDGGTDLVNSTHNATSGTNQTLAEPFKNGTTYYAKYAYAGIPDLLSGASQFSPLSGTVQLKCQ